MKWDVESGIGLRGLSYLRYTCQVGQFYLTVSENRFGWDYSVLAGNVKNAFRESDGEYLFDGELPIGDGYKTADEAKQAAVDSLKGILNAALYLLDGKDE